MTAPQIVNWRHVLVTPPNVGTQVVAVTAQYWHMVAGVICVQWGVFGVLEGGHFAEITHYAEVAMPNAERIGECPF